MKNFKTAVVEAPPEYKSRALMLYQSTCFGNDKMFCFQSTLVSMLPIVFLGDVLCLVHMCMLYSLYSFEYKWFNMGWELHRRLTFIESNWPYFIGFGLPLAVLTALPSSFFNR